MRRCLAVVVACVLAVPACGVGSEDEPQIIEESTQQPLPATPSFDTEPSPTRPTSPTTSSSAQTSVSSTAPGTGSSSEQTPTPMR
ncbi:hypothetical protein [Actinophytocola glycyrrhizae]|uniref:Uncharacterized protein n=1 Tax=Actinophytocola glycyrrhizae TaxID=2044873 RepID=A0ABV9SA06_9PSEU